MQFASTLHFVWKLDYLNYLSIWLHCELGAFGCGLLFELRSFLFSSLVPLLIVCVCVYVFFFFVINLFGYGYITKENISLGNNVPFKFAFFDWRIFLSKRMKWFWIFSIAKSERKVLYIAKIWYLIFSVKPKLYQKLIKDFCISYLVWLNIHKDDCHFFNIFLVRTLVTFARKQKLLTQKKLQV